jgi:hypothetical protein
MPRVRHHTDDGGLARIQASGVINPSRGWGLIESGVHVEVESFGQARPGLGGPKSEMGTAAEGAFVEFDAPVGMVAYVCGPRNTAIIPTSGPFSIHGLSPIFVKVRGSWWQLWRPTVDERRKL